MEKRLKLWWLSDKVNINQDLFDTISAIVQNQKDRREVNLRSLRLYGSKDLGSMDAFTANAITALPENRVKFNICSSVVDTVCARISKMKPSVTFLTEGGNWSLQRKAKNLQKFVHGLFYKNDIYRLHQKGFKACTVFDIGAIKHYVEGNEIKSEAVLSTELHVDETDAVYGDPRSLYQVKKVSKEYLSAQYPKEKAAIMMSTSDITHNFRKNDEEEDYVTVVEAWHLPGSKKSKDGRHVIATDKVTLVDEPYKKDFFPFTFFQWADPLVGFYSQSLVERLTGNQVEINKMLRIIQKSFHLGSAFKVFLEYGSKVSKDHINNEIGSIVYYAGNKPDFYVPQTVHPEYFRHLDWLVRSSFEEIGVSQMSATSKIPAGIDAGSGRALREYNEMESERFVLVAQAYEASFLQTARIYISLAQDMAKAGVDLEVKAESKKFLKSIKWSEIDLEDNEYMIQMFPASSLPRTPAGRLAYVQELIQAGFVDMDFARRLLDFPDIDQYSTLKTAPLDNILYTIEKVLDDGEFVTPEPFQNLDLGIMLMQEAYLKALNDGAPEEHLDMARRWIKQAKTLKQRGEPQPPNPQGVGAPQPGQQAFGGQALTAPLPGA